jgi:hypothetical protein
MACGIALLAIAVAIAAITAVGAAGALAGLCDVWQERQLPRALDGTRGLALMATAGPGDAPRPDLPALGHESAQHRDVLVVDLFDFLAAVRARLTPG